LRQRQRCLYWQQNENFYDDKFECLDIASALQQPSMLVVSSQLTATVLCHHLYSVTA